MDTIKVKITEAIYWEYSTRDVFMNVLDPFRTTVEVPISLAQEMADDAEFQSDPDGPEMHHSLKKAYASLAKHIRKSLEHEKPNG